MRGDFDKDSPRIRDGGTFMILLPPHHRGAGGDKSDYYDRFIDTLKPYFRSTFCQQKINAWVINTRHQRKVYAGGMGGIPGQFIVWFSARIGCSKLITVSIFSVASKTALFFSIISVDFLVCIFFISFVWGLFPVSILIVARIICCWCRNIEVYVVLFGSRFM